jgi:trimethylamine--corrinoid protein Co-methyltransferase
MDRSSVDRLLYCAENGIPFVYAAGANCGVAAPVTLAGAVALGTAESLAGLVVAQCVDESPRYIYGANSSSADMVSGKVLYGAPEWPKTVTMYAEMGALYNLPTWGTAGASDALGVDGQAGMEAYEGIMMAVQSGATLVHDVGFLAFGSLFDARMLPLANDMIVRARHLMDDVDVDAGSLALDAIEDVSRGRDDYTSFLEHPHTAAHFRDSLWIPPTYISRSLVDASQLQRDLREGLSVATNEILDGHTPKRLDDALAREITNYVLDL